MQNSTVPLDENQEVSYKTKYSLTIKHCNCALRSFPKELKTMSMQIFCTWIIIVAFFFPKIAEVWKQTICTSVGQWIDFDESK